MSCLAKATPSNDSLQRTARAAQASEEAVRLADAGDLKAGADALAQAAAPLASLAAAGDEQAAEQLQALRVKEQALRQYKYDAGLRKQLRQQGHQGRTGRRHP